MTLRRYLLLLALVSVAVVALAGGAGAQPGVRSDPLAAVIHLDSATGGGYLLHGAVGDRQAFDPAGAVVAGGGQYQIRAPELRGNGCCCTYLPCIRR